jgi:hypothetical protein
MRASWLVVALAACAPEIAPGSYLCGAEEACPAGQACDGSSDACVLASTATPFTCADGTDHPGDDTSATARALPALPCVSSPYRESGCLPAGDAADWFAFATPAECTAVEVQARISVPIAYEGLSLQLWNLDANSEIGSDVPCPDSIDDPAHAERCITLTVNPGGHYGLVVAPSGTGTCGGACAYNRYDLSVQLATPG